MPMSTYKRSVLRPENSWGFKRAVEKKVGRGGVNVENGRLQTRRLFHCCCCVLLHACRVRGLDVRPVTDRICAEIAI